MLFEPTAIADVILVTPRRFADDRGWFSEIFRQDLIDAALGPVAFVQENQSLSTRKGTVRGLHFQRAPSAQAKLVRCIRGAILDVAVDIRLGSPTFGRHVALELEASTGRQLFVPVGFAHGFCTLTDDAEVAYKVGAHYSAADEVGILWDDPDLGIAWPVTAAAATLSEKDRMLPRLRDLPAAFRSA